MPEAISLKFGMWSTEVGGNVHSKIRLVSSRKHRATEVRKLRFLSSCQYTHGVARRLLGPHDTLPCVLICISCVERPVVTPSTHNVSLGTNITFECTEFGSPPFTYQWFMRNTSMEGSDKLLVGEDKNTYNISSVLYSQTGLYYCEASNMLGILSNSTPANLLGENFF